MQIARRWCPVCNTMGPAIKESPSHLLHFFLTLFTAGFWLPIWILLTIGGAYRCQKCGSQTRFDRYGGVLGCAGLIGIIFLFFVISAFFGPSKNVPNKDSKPLPQSPSNAESSEQTKAQVNTFNNAPTDPQEDPGTSNPTITPLAPMADPSPVKSTLETTEKEATSRLNLAKQLLKTNKSAAERRLKEVVEKYPGTNAAAEAEELLKKSF